MWHTTPGSHLSHTCLISSWLALELKGGFSLFFGGGGGPNTSVSTHPDYKLGCFFGKFVKVSFGLLTSWLRC